MVAHMIGPCVFSTAMRAALGRIGRGPRQGSKCRRRTHTVEPSSPSTVGGVGGRKVAFDETKTSACRPRCRTYATSKQFTPDRELKFERPIRIFEMAH